MVGDLCHGNMRIDTNLALFAHSCIGLAYLYRFYDENDECEDQVVSSNFESGVTDPRCPITDLVIFRKSISKYLELELLLVQL